MFKKLLQTIRISLLALKSIDTTFKVLFLFSILILLNYEARIITLFWETKYTKALSTVGIQIVYSFVTGLIFYFLIEITKLTRKRIKIYRFLNNSVMEICRRSEFLVSGICTDYQTDGEIQKFNFHQFDGRCHEIKIHEVTIKVWFYEKLSFKEFVIRICNDIKGATSDQLNFLDYLDDDWLHCLSNIKDEISHIQTQLDLNGKSSTLNLVASHIWNLYHETQKLEGLCSKFYMDYHGEHRSQNRNYGFRDKEFTMNSNTKRLID